MMPPGLRRGPAIGPPHPLLMYKERTMRNSRLQAILEWTALAITIVCVWVFVPVQA